MTTYFICRCAPLFATLAANAQEFTTTVGTGWHGSILVLEVKGARRVRA
jgi:hypothetical protein